MPILFHKFITDSDPGIGLGLYITRRLVETLGGNIWAFNNKDGEVELVNNYDMLVIYNPRENKRVNAVFLKISPYTNRLRQLLLV